MLTFSGGERVAPPARGVILLVGPNNSGKSRFLREMIDRTCANVSGEPPGVLSEVQTHRGGDIEQAHQWLARHFTVVEHSGTFSVNGLGTSTSGQGSLDAYLRTAWVGGGTKNPMGPFLFRYASTGIRLSAGDAKVAHDALGSTPWEPIHLAYNDPDLERALSNAFRTAFGIDLVVDRLGGQNVGFRCGAAPDAVALGGHLTMPYLRACKALPRLEEQGDGMRAFVACLLDTVVAPRPVALLDEPEAFLHPPQARTLGTQVSRLAVARERQVFVATHSADFLRGVLDVAREHVCVLRLERKEGATHARVVDAAKVADLWSDPLLRASNLLDGLFHQHIVLCESDGDCRFYNAVLEALADADGEPRPDVMFAHTNGKTKLPLATRALVAAGVHVLVVGDIDVLHDTRPLQPLWEALGGTWSEIDHLHGAVAAGIPPATRLPVEAVRARLDALLQTLTEGPLREDQATELKTLGASHSGWSSVKRAGLAGIADASARNAAEQILAVLRQRGLHLVPEGELEGLCRDPGPKGNAWVARVLARDLLSDPLLEPARAFVRSLGLLEGSQ